MKRKSKKFQKKGGNSLNKLSLFQKTDGKFNKSCPLSVKDAPSIDYKNISLLKKYVTAEPEFVTAEVTPDDTYMVIASDGLWDVIDNDEVGRLCSKIKNSSLAAEYLANEAYKRDSADNICVLVVDLRTGNNDAENE